MMMIIIMVEEPLQEFSRFTCTLLASTPTVHITVYYYYKAKNMMLILLPQEGWKVGQEMPGRVQWSIYSIYSVTQQGHHWYSVDADRDVLHGMHIGQCFLVRCFIMVALCNRADHYIFAL